MGDECPECPTQGHCWCRRQNVFPKLLVEIKVLRHLQQPIIRRPCPPVRPPLPTAAELARSASPSTPGKAGRLGQPGRTLFHKVAIKILCSEFSLNDFKTSFLMTS